MLRRGSRRRHSQSPPTRPVPGAESPASRGRRARGSVEGRTVPTYPSTSARTMYEVLCKFLGTYQASGLPPAAREMGFHGISWAAVPVSRCLVETANLVRTKTCGNCPRKRHRGSAQGAGQPGCPQIPSSWGPTLRHGLQAALPRCQRSTVEHLQSASFENHFWSRATHSLSSSGDDLISPQLSRTKYSGIHERGTPPQTHC